MTANTYACEEYRELSRRGFLSLTGRGALAASALAAAPAWLPRVAIAKDHRGGRRDVIVSVFMRGAMDGMSICVPYGEPNYYSSRPTLSLRPPDSPDDFRTLALDDPMFALHPRMGALLPAYQSGHLLFVHATGTMDPTRSHFDGQLLMERGAFDGNQSSTGWLGRHLMSAAPTDPDALLRAVGITVGLPASLSGGPLTLPIPSLANFGLRGSPTSTATRQAVLERMYGRAPEPLFSAASTTVDTIDLLSKIGVETYRPAPGALYPATPLGHALRSSAALIKAEVGVEAIAIDAGGWDTHVQQGTRFGLLADSLGRLAEALGAFYSDTIANGASSVTLVAMSEFGRRLAENGQEGTDHGHGGLMMVMGGCIAGGRVLAEWPGLEPEQLFERMDLQVTIDYRDVLAEIVQRRMGNTNLDVVFPGYVPTMRGVTAC